MEINKIVELIEKFASLETQEQWDCSGYQIDLGSKDIKKILLCLSLTENIINQAFDKNCDMVISHHPLFFIPFKLNKNLPIYSAHTNLDKADGGTTDTLIDILGFSNAQKIGDFLRIIDLENEISLDDFVLMLKIKLNIFNVHVVNNFNKKNMRRIAFCAGSGADFIKDAEDINADAFVTGDVKYHTALDSSAIIIDVGHFESERPVLNTIKKLIGESGVEVIIADEKSPFIDY